MSNPYMDKLATLPCPVSAGRVMGVLQEAVAAGYTVEAWDDERDDWVSLTLFGFMPVGEKQLYGAPCKGEKTILFSQVRIVGVDE